MYVCRHIGATYQYIPQMSCRNEASMSIYMLQLKDVLPLLQLSGSAVAACLLQSFQVV